MPPAWCSTSQGVVTIMRGMQLAWVTFSRTQAKENGHGTRKTQNHDSVKYYYAIHLVVRSLYVCKLFCHASERHKSIEFVPVVCCAKIDPLQHSSNLPMRQLSSSLSLDARLPAIQIPSDLLLQFRYADLRLVLCEFCIPRRFPLHETTLFAFLGTLVLLVRGPAG